MQFEALKVFCDVARFRSFSQAAAVNSVSQSAASQIVLQLERRLGVQLINRSTRPLQLTAPGRTYYEGCKGLVDQYLELEASIRADEAQLAASVRVAAIYSVGLGDMGVLVERFVAEHPNAQVQVEYLHPNRVYQKVLDGTADLGLVSFPRKSRDLTTLPWREEEMVLTCMPQHPLAGNQSIKPEQLEGERYIGFDRDLVIRAKVDRFLRDQRTTVDVVMEFDNIENIKKAVEIGAGVALLPAPTLRREVEARTLVAVRLHDCRLVRPVGIIHRRLHKFSATALHFLEQLRQPEEAGTNGSSEGGAYASGTGPQTSVNGAQRNRTGSPRAFKGRG